MMTADVIPFLIYLHIIINSLMSRNFTCINDRINLRLSNIKDVVIFSFNYYTRYNQLPYVPNMINWINNKHIGHQYFFHLF